MSHLADANDAESRLTAKETRRISRIRLALKLGCLPSQLDAMPLTDFADLVEVLNGDAEIDRLEAWRAKNARKK